jgi:hypothetical protein
LAAVEDNADGALSAKSPAVSAEFQVSLVERPDVSLRSLSYLPGMKGSILKDLYQDIVTHLSSRDNTLVYQRNAFVCESVAAARIAGCRSTTAWHKQCSFERTHFNPDSNFNNFKPNEHSTKSSFERKCNSFIYSKSRRWQQTNVYHRMSHFSPPSLHEQAPHLTTQITAN